MDHPFRLRPSDSFTIGPRRVTLLRIKSNKRVTLRLSDDAGSSEVELVFGTPLVLERGVTIALDPNTSRASMSAGLVVCAPAEVAVSSPE